MYWGSTGLAKAVGSNQGLSAGDGAGVVRRASMAAKLMVRGDELGILVCAGRVDSCGRRAHCERRSADVANLSCQLEAAKDRAGDAVV